MMLLLPDGLVMVVLVLFTPLSLDLTLSKLFILVVIAAITMSNFQGVGTYSLKVRHFTIQA